MIDQGKRHSETLPQLDKLALLEALLKNLHIWEVSLPLDLHAFILSKGVVILKTLIRVYSDPKISTPSFLRIVAAVATMATVMAMAVDACCLGYFEDDVVHPINSNIFS